MLPPKRTFTLGNLVEMFLEARASGNPHTVDTDRHNIAALPNALLKRSLATIHAEDIRGHLITQLKRKAPSTVAREKTTLSALFTYAAELGLLHQAHPVRTMKKIPELSATARARSARRTYPLLRVWPRRSKPSETNAQISRTCSSSCPSRAFDGAKRALYVSTRSPGCRFRSSSSIDPTRTATTRRTPNRGEASERSPSRRERAKSSRSTRRANTPRTTCSPTSWASSSASASSGVSPGLRTTQPPPLRRVHVAAPGHTGKRSRRVSRRRGPHRPRCLRPRSGRGSATRSR